jgi:hypothetical protein
MADVSTCDDFDLVRVGHPFQSSIGSLLVLRILAPRSLPLVGSWYYDHNGA